MEEFTSIGGTWNSQEGKKTTEGGSLEQGPKKRSVCNRRGWLFVRTVILVLEAGAMKRSRHSGVLKVKANRGF